jgi:O-antigen ligase
VLSELANDFPAEGSTRLGVHFVRVLQLLLVFVSAYTVRSLVPVLFGWTLFGSIMLVCGLYVSATTGSLTIARWYVLPLGSTLGISLMVAAWATLAPLCSFSTFSLSAMIKSKIGRGVLVALGIGIMAATLFSGRREGLLAIAIGAMVMVVIGERRKTVPAFFALTLAAVVLYQAGPLRAFLEERESFQSELQGGGTGRVPLAEFSIDLWLQQPIFGYGPGTHERIIATYTNMPPGARGMHNSLSGNLLEAGIPGGLSVMVLFAGFLANCFRGARELVRARRRDVPALFVAAAGTVIAAFVAADACGSGAILAALGTIDAVWSRVASGGWGPGAEP